MADSVCHELDPEDTFAQVYPAEHKLLFDKVQLTLSIQGALAPRRTAKGSCLSSVKPEPV